MLVALAVLGCDPAVDPPDPPAHDPQAGPSAADTEPPGATEDSAEEDTAVPPPAAPTAFGPGFTDLTAPLWASGTFSQVGASGDGTAGPPLTATPNWLVAGDLYDDGVMDVYAGEVRHPDDEAVGPIARGHLFALHGDALIHDPDGTAALRQDGAGQVLALVDLDGDGDTDVLRSGLQHPVGLMGDDGTLTWPEVPVGEAVSALAGLKTGTLADLDQDGWLDILLATGSCQGGVDRNHAALYRTGLSTWSGQDALVAGVPGVASYAVMVLPLPGDDSRRTLFAAGLTCDLSEAHPGFVSEGPRGLDGRPTWALDDPLPEDALFRYDPVVAMGPVTRMNPMGSAVVDLDGDGQLDLFPTLADETMHRFMGRPTGGFEDLGLTDPVLWPRGTTGTEQLPWGVVPLDLDLDGRPDLVVAHGDDSSSLAEPIWNGPYDVTAWWNDGQGGFVELSEDVGLDAVGGWRSLWTQDLDGDADPDLLLGGYGSLPRVYRHDLQVADRRPLALDLVGTTSNHLGLGATVVVAGDPSLDRPAQTRLVGEVGTPQALGAPTLFFGLGDATVAEMVTIHWPSGTTQVLHDLPAGTRHEVVEPPVVTLSEADRHAPADGMATITITVTPRDDTGAAVARDDVQIAAGWGHDAWTGPPTTDDGGLTWTRTLLAPLREGSDALPASTVVQVTVDGTVVAVHPRLWWDPVP